MARRRSPKASPRMAGELMLYAENDGVLYRQREMPIARNLAKKMKKGTYKATKAAKGWYHWADAAARKYCKEVHCERPWNQEFNTATRRLVAARKARKFRQACGHGEYDFCEGVSLRGARRRRR